jgi:hypothetical protein
LVIASSIYASSHTSMKYITPIIILLTACSTPRQFIKPATIANTDNKGMKELIEKSFAAVQLNDSITTGPRAWQYSWQTDMVNYYDESGRAVRKIEMKSSDSIVQELLYSYSIGNDTMTTYRKQLDSSWKLYEMEYPDSNGIVIKTVENDWQFYRESTTAHRKKHTRSFIMNKHGINQHFKYDWENKGKYELVHTYTYFLNKKRQVIRHKTLNPDGTLWCSSMKRYNAHGHITYIKELFPMKHNQYRNKDTEYIHSYAYEYDAKGNWIKRIEYVDAKPTYILVREIVYY